MTNPKFMKFHWTEPHQSSRVNRNGYQRHHPNDETVPMDVDTPVFTMVRRAHSEADKARFKREGRCFSCDKQGHMAKDCPNQKKQFNLPKQFSRFDQSSSRSDQVRSGYGQPPSGSSHSFKKKSFNQPKRTSGFRKYNKPPQFKYTSQARTAHIEEVEEEEEPKEEDISSLAARTARLSEDQRDQWVNEMKDIGINF